MEENSTTPSVVMSEQENKNGLKIVTAISVIIAICGIGFGVWSFMQNNKLNAEIITLNAQIDTLNAKIAELSVPSISDAQSFLNEKLSLPLIYRAFGDAVDIDGNISYPNELLASESDRAMLIQAIAVAKNLQQDTGDENCQSGAYITMDTYKNLYKTLFGQDFEFSSTETYGTPGGFQDTPRVCDEYDTAIENGYYVWNNTLAPWAPTINLTVESVDGDFILGKITTNETENGATTTISEGNFKLKYGKNQGGYYIVNLSLTEK